jgi:hypothetical protein
MNPTQRVRQANSTFVRVRNTNILIAHAPAIPYSMDSFVVRNRQRTHQPILQAEPTRGRLEPASISTAMGIRW